MPGLRYSTARIVSLASLVMASLLPPIAASAVEIIGHRGASHDAPENTLASINLAWERNADAVEIDVYLTKDGRIVAVHDKTTERYGGPKKKIGAQTLEELKRIDVGRWKHPKYAGERIPTLAEVLQTIPDGKRLFIEIKTGPEIVPELKRVLAASKKKPQQVALISFSFEAITAAKKSLPDHEASWVVELKRNKITRKWKPALATTINRVKAANLDGLDFGRADAIDREYVTRVKQSGLKFYMWTVNSPEEARRLADYGVDGLTTDRPGWLREQMKQ